MFLAFGIGANDETMATVVGSGSLKLRIALIIGGVLVLIGCMFLSSSVGKTIGAGLVGQEVNYDNRMILVCVIEHNNLVNNRISNWCTH